MLAFLSLALLWIGVCASAHASRPDTILPMQPRPERDVGESVHFSDPVHPFYLETQPQDTLYRDYLETQHQEPLHRDALENPPKEESELEDSTSRKLLRHTPNKNPSPQSYRPMDCADLLVTGKKKNGLYEIFPFGCKCNKPVQVWCDMETDGGGWTVITTRIKGASMLKFNRTWDEYSDGFGDPKSEFWMGNDLIHLLTLGRNYYLRMDVKIFGELRYGLWTDFSLGSETQRYPLRLGGFSKESTLYQDCLVNAANNLFSTMDRDHDKVTGHCAKVRGSGWWYDNCPADVFDPIYLVNTCYNNMRIAPDFIQIKLRPAICSSPIKNVMFNTYNCDECKLP